jgi:hypothetical protein
LASLRQSIHRHLGLGSDFRVIGHAPNPMTGPPDVPLGESSFDSGN